jgi:hypothetical protein
MLQSGEPILIVLTPELAAKMLDVWAWRQQFPQRRYRLTLLEAAQANLPRLRSRNRKRGAVIRYSWSVR